MFKVGDKVICKVYGEGEVTAVEEFTQSGKEFISEDQPSLVKV